MPRVNPRLPTEKVVIARRFCEESIVKIDHSFGDQGVPLFLNSPTVAGFDVPFLIDKVYRKVREPKLGGPVSQIFEGRLEYASLPFGVYCGL
jgi:hypothetical protein